MTQLISIIIPVYNVESFLPKCIDSVLRQTYRDFEVLLIDDGSEDSSACICDEYAAKHECCRVFHRQNAGVAASRNFALSKARGKYIVFLDSDDYIEKEMLAKVYAQMELEKYDICSFSARRIDEVGKHLYDIYFVNVIGSRHFNDESRDLFLWNKFLQYQTGWECCFHVFRRDIIERYQIRFDEKLRYAEDLVFTFEYMLYVESWIKLPDVLYDYTLRSGSATKELDRKGMMDGIMHDAFGRMSERLEKKDSGRYDTAKISLFYAALLQYFYPIFSKGIEIESVREMLKGSMNWPVQEQQLKTLATQKRGLQKLFGEKDGAALYDKVKFFLDGNIEKYNKSRKKLLNK